MAKFKIKRLVSGGLITNYFCASSCRHCLYNCSPQWEKSYIRPQTAEKNLATIRRLGCASVHIGGGEPLLRPDALGDVLKIAGKVGVSVEYVETNSSWFKDPDSAMAMLVKLRKRTNISLTSVTDDVSQAERSSLKSSRFSNKPLNWLLWRRTMCQWANRRCC